jgi:hypothetical protein
MFLKKIIELYNNKFSVINVEKKIGGGNTWAMCHAFGAIKLEQE